MAILYLSCTFAKSTREMNKVYYLKTCSTNKKILSAFDLSSWEMREIKSSPITESELEELRKYAGSYEALFSKKSREIKAREIDLTKLQENDYKNLILDHYTFLKRPVFLWDESVYAGSSKEVIAELADKFDGSTDIPLKK